MMRLLSVNVGVPRTVEWDGQAVTTAIFKTPVAGPVPLAAHNLHGDRQADLKVHGGPDKAVYAYDAAHYEYWRAELPTHADWGPGLFGENLTTTGLLETEVRIGDVFGIGTAVLRAVQPRFPCYKLNVRFQDAGMVRRFAQAGRSGIYFRVEQPGTVQTGDRIELLEAAPSLVTVQTINDMVLQRTAPLPDVRTAALALPHLPAGLKRQLKG